MVDFKTDLYARLLVAFVLAVLTYTILTPIITIYGRITVLFTCDTSNFACAIVQPFLTIVIPIIALFLCVWAIFEVFYK